MKKITKHVITITVYILIIIYFLVFASKKEFGPSQSTICKNFDIILSNRIERHFITSLPKSDGETSRVTVDELISEGLITLEDIEEVGTSCSGEAYVSKVGERYYYYNNIACGKCSINNMYTAWSDWTETLPNFGNKKYQIMISILYNYSSSDERWSDWSEWGESIEKIKAPTLPTGVEVLNTDQQEKTQYRYREATYKWYKLSSDIEYYNNGAYSETAPSGYERLDSSKKYKRTTKAYETKTELKQKENVKDVDTVTTVNGYRIKTPKYIYSYTSPSTTRTTDVCETSVTKYICYKSTDTTYEVPDVSTSQSTALSTCKSQQPSWASTCTTYVSKAEVTGTQQYVEGTYKFNVNGRFAFNMADGSYCGSYQGCSLHIDRLPAGYECKTGNDRTDMAYMKTLVSTAVKNYSAYGGSYNSCKHDGICSVSRIGANNIIDISTVTSCNMTSNGDGHYEEVGGSPAKYGYKYTVTARTDTGSTYYSTCPSEYPNKDTSKVKTECTKYKTEVVPGETKYLTISGREVTSIAEADYLSESEYNALKSSNSSLAKYSKSDKVMYSYETTSYQEGNCPSGKTCDIKTLYKATIYEFKWFKTSSTSKIDCKSGAYSATAPEVECIKDESTAKWGSWSEFSDNVVKKTDNNEVETKKLVRYRVSYISSKDLVNKEWYDYQDFEEKTGKKIEDLRKDKNVNLQEKVVYKYRILK